MQLSCKMTAMVGVGSREDVAKVASNCWHFLRRPWLDSAILFEPRIMQTATGWH